MVPFEFNETVVTHKWRVRMWCSCQIQNHPISISTSHHFFSSNLSSVKKYIYNNCYSLIKHQYLLLLAYTIETNIYRRCKIRVAAHRPKIAQNAFHLGPRPILLADTLIANQFDLWMSISFHKLRWICLFTMKVVISVYSSERTEATRSGLKCPLHERKRGNCYVHCSVVIGPPYISLSCALH